MAHTHQVLDAIHDFLWALYASESSARGYEISGEQSFLDAYNGRRQDVGVRLEALRRLTADNPPEQQRLSLIGDLLQRKLAVMDDLVRDRKAGKSVAIRVDDLLRSRALLQELAEQTDAMIAEEESLLLQRQAAAERQVAVTQRSIAIGTGALLALILLMMFGLTDRIVTRLRTLAEGARRLGAGDMSVRAQVTPGNDGDELNQLAVAFNHMADDLAGRDRQLAAAAEERDRFFSMSLDMLCIAGFDGRFKRVNPAFTSTLGYSADELLATPFLEFVHPDDRDPTVNTVAILDRGEAVTDFKNRYRCKDGSWRWLEWKAVSHPSGLIYAVGRDVTEQKHNETALRDSEERYRALFKSSPFPMWTFDLETLRFLEVNDAAVYDYGYSREEFLARTIVDIRPEEDVPRLMKTLSVHTDEPDRFGLWRHRKRNGEVIDVEVSSHRICIGGHVVDLVVAVDVTERRRSQIQIEQQNRALELSRKEAERANQMKSEFLATMSHELRTPLNAILGFSELLEDQAPGPLNEKQVRFVGHIRTGARHLLQLINDILDLSRIEAGQLELQREDFPTYSVVPEVISLIRPLAMGKRVRLDSAPPEHDPIVHADRIRLKQVLYNLLSNAVKFTASGGSVSLQVGTRDGRPTITVADTGVGIRPEDQVKIFEEFRQVGDESSKKEGTGLGLAITRRLVECQGGTISVESKLGEGSRFTVVLAPGTESPFAAAIAPSPVATPDSITRARPLILVIDDDRLTRQLVASFLTPEGFDVRGSEGGADALRLARDLHPDAITLDVLMPVSGWNILGELKKDPQTAGIPVVVVTIVDQQSAAFALGAVDYLVKPVSREALLRILRRHLTPAPRPHRILVIDDNPIDLHVISEVLDSVGFVPLQASGGAEGLATLEKERPDAVMLDLVMPDVDGFEVLRQMKKMSAFQSLPVFILTAKELSDEEARFLSSEAHALLAKAGPWKEDLLVKLRQILIKRNGAGNGGGK